MTSAEQRAAIDRARLSGMAPRWLRERRGRDRKRRAEALLQRRLDEKARLVLSARLVRLRVRIGLSERELAARVGALHGRVQRWESGEAPRAEVIPRLAKALGVTCNYLLTGRL